MGPKPCRLGAAGLGFCKALCSSARHVPGASHCSFNQIVSAFALEQAWAKAALSMPAFLCSSLQTLSSPIQIRKSKRKQGSLKISSEPN